MKKFGKIFAMIAVCAIGVVGLTACGGSKVSEKDWHKAFWEKNFDNVSVTMNTKETTTTKDVDGKLNSQTSTLKIEYKITADAVYSKMTSNSGAKDETDTVRESYFGKASDGKYYKYAKNAEDKWERTEISKSDFESDRKDIVRNINFSGSDYSYFDFEYKDGVYKNAASNDDITITFADKKLTKLASSDSNIEADGTGEQMEGTVEYNAYGSTSVTLPTVA